MQQLLVAGLLTFVLGTTFACAAGRSKVVTRDDLKVGAQPTVVVDSDRGNVELVAGAAGVVTVEAERQAASDDAARRLAASAKVDGNVVRVQFRVTRGGGANDQVAFRITAPADTRVEVHTRAGNVEARGFRGDVQLATKAGNMKVDNLAGVAKLRADAGTLTAHGIVGSIDAVSGGGDMHLDGAPRGTCRLETGGGELHVSLPSDAKLVINAKSGGGKIRNEFGLPVSCPPGACTWRGTLGDGSGGSLELRTGGGSIVIGKSTDGAASSAR